jgi:hypothetical protein
MIKLHKTGKVALGMLLAKIIPSCLLSDTFIDVIFAPQKVALLSYDT